MNHIQIEEIQAERKALDLAAREHLAMLHQAIAHLEEGLWGKKMTERQHQFMEKARRYLRRHWRTDADFADLGRRLKYQYNSTANGKDMPPEPAPDGSENRNGSPAGEGWSSSDC